MNVPLDEVIFFDAITTTPATSAAVDADSPPTFAVFEESTDTDIGVGGSMTKRTSLTGNYRGTFTLSAANGFEVGKWYSVIGTGIVGGVTGKAVLKNFRVVAAESLAGYPKNDVHALKGDAQSATDLQDFADAGYDPSTNKVQGVVLTDTVTTYTGNTPQTGDVFPLVSTEIADIIATLATIAAYIDTEVAAIKAKTDNLPSDPADASDIASSFSTVNSTLTTIAAYIDTEVAAIKAKTDSLTFTVAGVVDSNVTHVNGSVASGTGTPDVNVASIGPDVITASALAADAVTEIQSGLATASALATVATYVDTEVAAIKAKTDNLPADPADASDIAAAFATVNSTLATIAAYVDTEVAAIKAKTDNLPSDPADQSAIIVATDALLAEVQKIHRAATAVTAGGAVTRHIVGGQSVSEIIDGNSP